MIITDSAKIMLQETLTESKNNCIQIKLQKSCCGTSLFFQMAKLPEGDTQATHINGVPFIMDQEVKARTSDIIIDYKDGELVLDDPSAPKCN